MKKDFVKGIRVKNKEWNSMVEEYRKKFSIKITSSKHQSCRKWKADNTA